ncbi:MAG: substrate-binding domain-containing protein [Saccharospirillum sp.]
MKPVWAICLLLICLIHPVQARDHIRIVGSSTVFPFAAALAERFGRLTDHRAPVIEATGSGGGIRLFCSGLGLRSADIVSASRAMTDSERADCAANGVGDILDIQLGFDALVVANQRQAPAFSLTRQDLYRALARHLPDPDTGELIDNWHSRWQQVREALPDLPIRVYGPPPTSGTRDAFIAQIMQPGCQAEPALQPLFEADPAASRQVCETVREDGAFIEAGESDALIVSRLDTDATALGVFGYSFLNSNADRVKSLPIEGVAATPERLAAGQYPIMRPLFLYVKAGHLGVIPGLDAFVAETLSPEATGPNGYLDARGLIPLPVTAHEQMRRAVEQRMPPLVGL